MKACPRVHVNTSNYLPGSTCPGDQLIALSPSSINHPINLHAAYRHRQERFR